LYTLFGFIARPLGYLLAGIYGFVGNYGLTLIIFTVIVRLCLFPLYVNQTRHTMKMGGVQPRIKEIQKKYAHDKEEMNKQMMAIYKEENFNPAKGCLPMLIQMPIILGLFTLLRNPMTYLPKGDLATMIFSVHESFFWIKDLSHPDLWILPILAGITTYISFSISQSQGGMGMGDNPQAQQMAGMMKGMKYFFPIMIVWMGRTFPAGLTLYWFIGNLCTVLQAQVLKNMKKRYAQKEKDKKDGRYKKNDKRK
jgi:YidC/Oxa1 family membrane protein insertase